MKIRGIVVKIKDSHFLVLASDGTYHKVRASQHKGARVGSEIQFALNDWHRFIKPALLVASILVFALGLSLFQQAALQPAFAYVSLDINPSIELEVDSDLQVISANPLNEDARNLLSRVKVSGQLLSVSVNSILAEAVTEGFLKPGQKNYVLSAVTLADESAENTGYEALTSQINVAAQNKGVDVELLVLEADSELRTDAKTKGMSAGKLLVYREAVAAGQSVSLQQVKETSITNLVNNYNIKLLPNGKKIIIKPAKDSEKDKKDQSSKGEKQVNGPGKMDRNDSAGTEQSGDQEKGITGNNGYKNQGNGRKEPKSNDLHDKGKNTDTDTGTGTGTDTDTGTGVGNGSNKNDYSGSDKSGNDSGAGQAVENEKNKEKTNSHESSKKDNSRQDNKVSN